MKFMLWKASRYWNRLAFLLMEIGRRMIWDQTTLNEDILPHVIDKTTKAIMCDYPVWPWDDE